MTTLDYFVIGVTSLSLAFGLAKGFIRSVLGLVVALAGLYLAATFYPVVESVIRGWVETDAMARLVAFLTLFVATVVAGLIVGRAFRRVLEKTHLSWIDHLAGGAFGFVRGWLICSVVYVALTAFPAQLDMVARATLAPYLLKGAEMLTMATSRNLRDQFLDGYYRLKARWGLLPTGQ
jgi:membrane protein required for colicin V production